MRILQVFVGQGISQALTVFTGIIIVRTMSVESYAEYGVVLSFQGALAILVDLGFSGCIVSLVGDRGSQPDVVGKYIATAQWYRTRLFLLVIPLAGLAFYYIGLKQKWSLSSQIPLFICVVAGLYSQGKISWYSAPLYIHHQIHSVYSIQIIAGIGRLLSAILLNLAGALSALTLSAANTVSLIWTAVKFTDKAEPYVSPLEISDRPVRIEMFNLVAPQLPGIVFAAVQGQLSVFLISIFGKTQNIAEVSALGRLGQLFILISAINATLIQPYFAQVSSDRFWIKYIQVVGASLLFAAATVLVSIFFSSPLLWVLGHKYEHLDQELIWMMLGGALGYIGGVMWTINIARKWVFWWGTFLHIGLLTSVQVVLIACLDLRTTLSVLFLGCASNLAVLIGQFTINIIGFRLTARKKRLS